MKKQIFTLTMCLVLTAPTALAVRTNNVTPKARVNQEIKSITKSNLKTNGDASLSSRDEAKKSFEEKKTKQRERMYNELGLSPEQKAKAEAADLKSKEEAVPLFKKVQVEAKKLKELRTKKASALEIWKQEKTLKAAKNNLKKHMEASRKAFESILTKEQEVKFSSIKEGKKREMGEFKKSHKHHGPKCQCAEHHKAEHMGPTLENIEPDGSQEHPSMPFPPKDKK